MAKVTVSVREGVKRLIVEDGFGLGIYLTSDDVRLIIKEADNEGMIHDGLFHCCGQRGTGTEALEKEWP